MTITARHAADLFNISRETVRQYAQEFATYFSPGANPGGGRARLFTEDDVKVLALITDMKAHGFRYEDIHLALHNGQRGEVPEQIRKVIPMEQTLTSQQQIAALATKVTDLEKQIASRDGAIEELRQQLTDARSEIARLNREVGRLGG